MAEVLLVQRIMGQILQHTLWFRNHGQSNKVTKQDTYHLEAALHGICVSGLDEVVVSCAGL